MFFRLYGPKTVFLEGRVEKWNFHIKLFIPEKSTLGVFNLVIKWWREHEIWCIGWCCICFGTVPAGLFTEQALRFSISELSGLCCTQSSGCDIASMFLLATAFLSNDCKALVQGQIILLWMAFFHFCAFILQHLKEAFARKTALRE